MQLLDSFLILGRHTTFDWPKVAKSHLGAAECLVFCG